MGGHKEGKGGILRGLLCCDDAGLELRDYQRQALQWMLQREEEPSDKPTPSPSDDDTKPAAQADDAG